MTHEATDADQIRGATVNDLLTTVTVHFEPNQRRPVLDCQDDVVSHILAEPAQPELRLPPLERSSIG